MAYKNLVGEAIASRAEAFKRFRDWMCKRNGSYDYSVLGLGWTLHDAVYAIDQHTITAGDYYVLYSAGESGKEDIYVKVVFSATANTNQITICQYWNATTHVGVNVMAAVSNWTVADITSGALYIYADMDSCLVGTYIGTGKNACAFGLVEALYDRTISICSSPISAGSGVTVALDAVPASWVVGGRVMVRDNANAEILTISNLSGLNVTFSAFVASYAAGCKFAQDYPLVCSTGSLLAVYRSMISHDGTKMDSLATTALPDAPGLSGDPDPLDGEWLAAQYPIKDATGGYAGTLRNILAGSAAFADLGVFTTSSGVNYRAFAWATGAYFLFKEV